MEIVHVYGWELTKVMIDNLILLLWTIVFACLGYIGGRIHATMIESTEVQGE